MIADERQTLFGPPAASEESKQEEAVLAEAHRRTRRSFIVGAASTVGLLGAAVWTLKRPKIDGVAGPLRRTLDFNGAVSRTVLGARALAPTYPVSRAVAD